nr:NADH dehydrogenase subunit 6 [Microcotyle caudata]
MLLNFLCFLYFLTLGSFIIIVNPVMCSVLLMINSSVLGLLLYLFLGSSWMSLLICMVYLGGVYIIMLFVSSCTQNDQEWLTSSYFYIFIFFVSLLASLVVCNVELFDYISFNNSLNFLVLVDNWVMYLGYTSVLLFLFFLLGLVMVSKDGFLR